MSSSLKKGAKSKGPKQLSRTVMAMKFMKRRIANEEQSDEYKIAPGDAWYASTPLEVKKAWKPPETLSYSACMDLMENGHLSFGKFNKEVEREMIAMAREDKGEQSNSDRSISDNEMVERYENLIGTLGKKMKRKKADDLDFQDTDPSIPKKRRKSRRKHNEQQNNN